MDKEIEFEVWLVGQVIDPLILRQIIAYTAYPAHVTQNTNLWNKT